MFEEVEKIQKVLEENADAIVGYVRVNGGGDTIVDVKKQQDIINEFCKEVNVQCREFYTETGCSGLNLDRPLFKKMIQSETCKVILITDITRLSRSFIEIMNIKQKTDKIFISISELMII